MAGLKANFAMGAVRQSLDQFVGEIENKTLEALQYAGEEFVNKARENGNYMDDTGNLRSSIGYVILKNGNIIDKNFRPSGEGYESGADGVTAAWNLIDDLKDNFSEGYVLIGVAGMKYAAAVESLGYDVITGSAPGSSDIKDLMGAIQI